MALNWGNKGLRELMAARNKGSTLKEVPKSQVPPTLPLPPPLPPIDIELHAIPNLKKKGTKQQKTAKDLRDKKATSVDSQEEQTGAEVRLQHCTWSLQLEVDGVAIPWNASVREFQRSHFAHIAKTLEQPLFLPKDMDAVRKMRQPDLFMSLKRDLAMVSSQPHTFYLFKY